MKCGRAIVGRLGSTQDDWPGGVPSVIGRSGQTSTPSQMVVVPFSARISSRQDVVLAPRTC